MTPYRTISLQKLYIEQFQVDTYHFTETSVLFAEWEYLNLDSYKDVSN